MHGPDVDGADGEDGARANETVLFKTGGGRDACGVFKIPAIVWRRSILPACELTRLHQNGFAV